MRKGSGPRTEPCGTPESVSSHSDLEPFKSMCCFQENRILNLKNVFIAINRNKLKNLLFKAFLEGYDELVKN